MIQMFLSCRPKVSESAEQIPVVSVITTAVTQGDIENFLSLNGKTVFLRKNSIISPISGYVIKINVSYGEAVNKEDILFEVQTKESKALEDPESVKGNPGIIKVTAPAGGTVSELFINQTGGYIVEGGPMCSIVETSDFVIQMNVPFQYNAIVKKGMKCKMILPDNTAIEGYVYKILPVINEAAQTQNVLIKPLSNRQLPENLNLIVQFVTEKHTGVLKTVKEAIMANETQSEFWVMKVINNNMALKVPVTKGIENGSVVEISSPILNLNDLLISEGAYGMTDSTVIKIEK
jgi:biotin carboxyl carrier protein